MFWELKLIADFTGFSYEVGSFIWFLNVMTYLKKKDEMEKYTMCKLIISMIWLAWVKTQTDKEKSVVYGNSITASIKLLNILVDRDWENVCIAEHAKNNTI